MPLYSSLSEKQELIRKGNLSLTVNVRDFLSRIEQIKDVNAFLAVFPEKSVELAIEIEKKIISGKHGKLAGLVVGVKDVLALKNEIMTCGSAILQNFSPVYDATSVRKLIEEDAIIIGKTNCDEFAMGSSNENSAYGNVKNPYDHSKVPGGSSGGSAAAVSAGLCDAALGTDTGGSVRQPASFCGILGLKPTYGAVSRYGLTSFASSFDSVGVFANSIEDIFAIHDVIKGFDELDSTSVDSENSYCHDESRPLRIGIPVEYFDEGLATEIRHSAELIIERLKELGQTIIEVSLPNMRLAIPAYYILTTAEASSNLSRYDGVRFGLRTEKDGLLSSLYADTRSGGFGREVKRRIMLGTYVLSKGYYDAYYQKAQKVRRIIREDFLQVFNEVDLLLTPTTPTTAFNIGEKSENPLEMYLSDIYTTSVNLAGLPALNFPAGKDQNGLPFGLQFIAPYFCEDLLIKAVQLLNSDS